MRDRGEQVLRIVCLGLAALLLYQLVKVALRVNPLRGVAIPALPALASDTNAPANEVGKGSNSAPARAKGTNSSPRASGTNFVAGSALKAAGINLAANVSTNLGGTNTFGPLPPSAGEREIGAAPGSVATDPTNSQVLDPAPKAANAEATISPSPAVVGTNVVPLPSVINSNSTATISQTNFLLTPTNTGTDAAKVAKSKKKGTNSAAPPEMAMPGMNFGPPGMRGGPAPELPPEIKARVNRIYESEILGQVMHPLPLGLLGIAGNFAILRAPSGQTGLVKLGDSLGEIKLLRIGINRVLVEQDGQKKELTIFDGYGGDSLLPKEKETSK